MVRSTEAEQLLNPARLTHPCDLDLLLFFHRHPTSIMASEHLALLAGYDLAQVARSLDALVAARVLRRSLKPTHIGRLYSFTNEGAGTWLPSLLAAASTPDGRRQLIRVLQQQDSTRGDETNPSRSYRETAEEANHA